MGPGPNTGPYAGPPAVGSSGPQGPVAGGRRRGAPRTDRAPLWKRLHLPWIAGIAVLLPVSLVGPWWLETEKWEETGAVPPEPVPAQDATASLAGSDWELAGVVVDEYIGAEPPPAGITLVDAVFKATPSDERSAEMLETCSFQATDDRGRTWETTNEYANRAGLEDVVFPGFLGCTDTEGEPLRPGDTGGFVASFLVPEDAADSLRFRVDVDTGTGEDEDDPRAPVAAEFENPEEDD
ncbi:hypothetical protein [Nocardiopsis baichengensis]|uniref:hypothetical protein n=1 Tax=Nocardiopsis baichengensis TaxID=280240 RepID=UPI0003459F44|nr:hypothetical protein [Nocardiopsis baichengensis]